MAQTCKNCNQEIRINPEFYNGLCSDCGPTFNRVKRTFDIIRNLDDKCYKTSDDIMQNTDIADNYKNAFHRHMIEAIRELDKARNVLFKGIEEFKEF